MIGDVPISGMGTLDVADAVVLEEAHARDGGVLGLGIATYDGNGTGKTHF